MIDGRHVADEAKEILRESGYRLSMEGLDVNTEQGYNRWRTLIDEVGREREQNRQICTIPPEMH